MVLTLPRTTQLGRFAERDLREDSSTPADVRTNVVKVPGHLDAFVDWHFVEDDLEKYRVRRLLQELTELSIRLDR